MTSLAPPHATHAIHQSDTAPDPLPAHQTRSTATSISTTDASTQKIMPTTKSSAKSGTTTPPSLAALPHSHQLQSTQSLQYARYRARGGLRPLGPHTRDFRHNSPNHQNMTTGQDYRAWTQNYYTLGEATRNHDRWLAHPNQNPPRSTYIQPSHHIRREDTVAPPYLPSFSPTRQPAPTNRTSNSDQDSDSEDTINIRTQTYAETMTLGPDDPNAVIDSGAMMTTVPRRLLLGTPWEDTIHPAARPGTTIRYGNMETETVEDAARVGNYEASIVPDRFKTALLCVHDIVSTGHTVLFTDNRRPLLT